MIARIIPKKGSAFHIEWLGGQVVADSTSAVAAKCLAYLNGTPTLHPGEAKEGGTDGHLVEERELRSEAEFLVTVGSLADRFFVTVQLLGELSDADHEEILNNPEADRRISGRAIERAIAKGMSREDAVRLYGFRDPLRD